MSGRARGRALRTQSVPPGASASVPEAPARSDIGRFNQGPTLAEVAQVHADAARASSYQDERAKMETLYYGSGNLTISSTESVPEGTSGVSSKPAIVEDIRGTSGKQVILLSNMFKLNRLTNFRLFQYHVDFKPDVPNKVMRKKIILNHQDVIGRISMFDGMILFLPIQLPKITVLTSMQSIDNVQIKTTLKLTNELEPSSPMCMQLYNIIFKRILTYINLVPIGKNYYSSSQAITNHQRKLEVWPGFVTSILQFEKNIMLIADVSHKILNGVTVLNIMMDLSQKYGQDVQGFREACVKKLIGEIVLTRYNNKTYRLDDIDWNQTPENVFALGGVENMISFSDFYFQNYGRVIYDKKQPILISMPKSKGKRRAIGLVPELCYLTGLSEEVRSDFNAMKDLSLHTRLGPSQRIRALEGLMQKINSDETASAELSNWNLEFAQSLLTIPSRQLGPETIALGSKKFKYDEATAEWSSQMKNQRLMSPVHINNWIVMHTQHDLNQAQDFCEVLSRVCPGFGMTVSPANLVQLPNDNVPTLVSVLKAHITSDTRLVVCILPKNRKDRYDCVKTYCCIDRPVPSQLILSETLQKHPAMQVSVVKKLALQLNCKLGGELWSVEIPIKKVMIVGINCYHDSSRRGHSVGALVASTNANFTQFYSRCSFQSSMEELMTRMKSCLTDAVKAYENINGFLPERIIIYRDGVGDGQLMSVMEQEVSQMKHIFEAASPEYNPRFAFIVVKKRINSRFYTKHQDGSVSNPLPGTIIDTEATHQDWYDFFVISQSVRQGAVSPTHYNVLHDTTGLRADHLQRLTYKLCHLYFNWPGTIRVPAPCQYAHKLAFLVGQTLHKEPAMVLSNKLFFL